MLQDEYPFSPKCGIDLPKVEAKYGFNVNDYFEPGAPIFPSQLNYIIEARKDFMPLEMVRNNLRHMGEREWKEWVACHTTEEVQEQLRVQQSERDRFEASRKKEMTQEEIVTLVKKLYKCVHPESTEMAFINGLVKQHDIDQTINLTTNQMRRLEEIKDMYGQSLGNQ